MTKLRLVPYRELHKVAEAAGFHWVRREGSHNSFRNAAGRIVVIPDHGSHVIVRPLLRKSCAGRSGLLRKFCAILVLNCCKSRAFVGWHVTCEAEGSLMYLSG